MTCPNTWQTTAHRCYERGMLVMQAGSRIRCSRILQLCRSW